MHGRHSGAALRKQLPTRDKVSAPFPLLAMRGRPELATAFRAFREKETNHVENSDDSGRSDTGPARAGRSELQEGRRRDIDQLPRSKEPDRNTWNSNRRPEGRSGRECSQPLAGTERY